MNKISTEFSIYQPRFKKISADFFSNNMDYSSQLHKIEHDINKITPIFSSFFIVGGCLRDFILSKPISDIDILLPVSSSSIFYYHLPFLLEKLNDNFSEVIVITKENFIKANCSYLDSNFDLEAIIKIKDSKLNFHIDLLFPSTSVTKYLQSFNLDLSCIFHEYKNNSLNSLDDFCNSTYISNEFYDNFYYKRLTIQKSSQYIISSIGNNFNLFIKYFNKIKNKYSEFSFDNNELNFLSKKQIQEFHYYILNENLPKKDFLKNKYTKI